MSRNPSRAVALALAIVLASLPHPGCTRDPAAGAASPEDLLDAWVELWRSYDLDRVADLFLRDERLTYFSSETENLIQGFEAIVEHHRGFGFVPGGSAQERMIWVADVQTRHFGEAALIGAIWYFGDPGAPAAAQRGPMTMLAVRASDGFRIAHMHFATYAEPQP